MSCPSTANPLRGPTNLVPPCKLSLVAEFPEDIILCTDCQTADIRSTAVTSYDDVQELEHLVPNTGAHLLASISARLSLLRLACMTVAGTLHLGSILAAYVGVPSS